MYSSSAGIQMVNSSVRIYIFGERDNSNGQLFYFGFELDQLEQARTVQADGNLSEDSKKFNRKFAEMKA